MKDFEEEWGFYLQAYRLLQSLSRNSNAEARRLLKEAIDTAAKKGRTIARAHGLMSFAVLNASLCDWIDVTEAEEIVARCLELVPEGDDAEVRGMLQALQQKEMHRDAAIRTVIRTYGYEARYRDKTDFENHWSAATADLYNGNWQDAQDGYIRAMDIAIDPHNKGLIPQVGKSSLAVDFADFRFFAGNDMLDDTPNAWIEAIEEAIVIAKQAMIDNPYDPKRHRWNWTLGWAYYELAAYKDPYENLDLSLHALKELIVPHDLIRKNLIVTYTARNKQSEAADKAKCVSDFWTNNPHYKIDVEDRWPYRNPNHRDRWKRDLAKGLGL